MSASCCSHTPSADEHAHRQSGRERRVLWIALVINAAMFALEIIAGSHAGSSSLQADALDFLADTANYAVSLFVVGAALRARAKAALLKGGSMGLLGLWVLVHTAVQLWRGDVPRAEVMGIVGILALVSNVVVLELLTSFRRGDANMRSVWICSRNDAIGNLAVLLAASGVFAMHAGWPDAIVAIGMAALALHGAWQVVTSAWHELRIIGGVPSSPPYPPRRLPSVSEPPDRDARPRASPGEAPRSG